MNAIVHQLHFQNIFVPYWSSLKFSDLFFKFSCLWIFLGGGKNFLKANMGAGNLPMIQISSYVNNFFPFIKKTNLRPVIEDLSNGATDFQ